MLQLTALLLLSWIFLRLFTKADLSVLGLRPNRERLSYFLILFMVSGFLSATAFFLRIFIARENYIFNSALRMPIVLLEIWHQLRGVLTEELLCRGALLYILIKKTGKTKAIVISSVCFAVLHWMNAGLWGHLIQMIIVFAFTFSMGILLAYAYARTFSLLIPIAIHFGWNLSQNVIFPDQSGVIHVFKLAEPPPEVTISYLAFFTLLLLPKISVLLVNFLILKTHKQVITP